MCQQSIYQRCFFNLIWSIACIIHFSPVVTSEDTYFPVEKVEKLLEKRAGSPWWFANIARHGTVPFNSDPNYVLYRNVADYGAVGDGHANDTQAFLDAFFLGPRCVGQFDPVNPCQSSTIQPAIVYVPPGTYFLTNRIIMPYNSIIIGDALDMPTLKASADFNDIAILDPDPYVSGNDQWYANQNNFFRQVRNLILDTTNTGVSSTVAGVHWQVAQATSLQNLVFNMIVSKDENNKQQGIFMENGSGGFMRDLIFNGGGIGFFLGNQQFTSTNLTFNNCYKGIRMNQNWLWSFKDITFNGCTIGIDMVQAGDPSIGPGSPSLGSAILADSTFINTDTGIVSTYNCSYSKPASAGTLIVDNVDFTGAGIAIRNPNGTVILPGGSVVAGFMAGNVYSAQYAQRFFPNHDNQTCYVPQAIPSCYQEAYTPPTKPAGLLGPNGKVFDRAKPAYDDFTVSQFISAKVDFGCAGDGVADDSDCLQNLFNSVNFNQVAYIDGGAYVVTKPIFIKPNIRIMGEGWPKIMIKGGSFWGDKANPEVAFTVGNKGDIGKLEMQDIVFETQGPTPGAIVMEWNLEEDAQGSAGMWDVHWRMGGSAGTLMQENCIKTPTEVLSVADPNCFTAFLLLHITETASLYMENNWGWVADHELDQLPNDQLNIWNGRGLLIESVKPVWVVGGSFEHSQLYNYQVANAKNVYMSHIQSETAYMQDNPIATLAYPPQASWDDPDFSFCQGLTKCVKTFGLRIYNSTYVYIYGAGLYSFFQNYDSSCLVPHSCQTNAASIELSEAVYVYGLYSVGHDNMMLMDQTPLVPQGDNSNTFGESIALFEYE
ncbi:pectin lyase-like protein [Microthyrium microscopicum]|uniref:Pectin lyase-like protein n=1 Tax=Microthyrium microscopicum TaxID=703497 RepID=A0A6A6USU5_9PEZI|nr:pectin lyase-like protein [Microthyrium microscopicum]